MRLMDNEKIDWINNIRNNIIDQCSIKKELYNKSIDEKYDIEVRRSDKWFYRLIKGIIFKVPNI